DRAGRLAGGPAGLRPRRAALAAPRLGRDRTDLDGGDPAPMSHPLKTPFPYYGGKSTVAALVWHRLGAVDNYIEPFAGSLALLMRRPTPFKGVETCNDADCMVTNFWRATAAEPERVAEFADGPVHEADLHARHRWLVLSENAAAFRQRM